MAAQDSTKETFKVKFSRATDYRIIPATGAWGGVTPNGEIVFDLYVERRENPESIEIEVVDGEQVGEKRHPHPQPFEREAQIGVVVRPDIAKAIGEFLIGMADKAAIPKEESES